MYSPVIARAKPDEIMLTTVGQTGSMTAALLGTKRKASENSHVG
jgi:hypothetical protein